MVAENRRVLDETSDGVKHTATVVDAASASNHKQLQRLAGLPGHVTGGDGIGDAPSDQVMAGKEGG
jgi:hypothetical protein